MSENRPAIRVYTTQEAAQLTGSTVRALRKRIERGQLRAVQHGRYWRIPHSELERVGLLVPAEGTEGADLDAAAVLASLERLRAEHVQLRQEIAALRPLRDWLAAATRELQRERSERQEAEARAEAAARSLADLRERHLRMATAGFVERSRLLRALRRRSPAGL